MTRQVGPGRGGRVSVAGPERPTWHQPGHNAPGVPRRQLEPRCRGQGSGPVSGLCRWPPLSGAHEGAGADRIRFNSRSARAPWTPGEAQPGPATSQLSRNLPPKTQQSQHSQKPTTKQGEGKFSLDKLTRMLQLENLGGFLKISS